MKKILSVVAFVLTLVCVLSSCAQSSSPSVETTDTTLGETTTATPEVTTPEGSVPQKPTVYVQEIKCESITLLRETPVVVEKYVNQYEEPDEDEPVKFRFEFIQAPEGTSYTTDPESLASNPNRVRINYEIFPEEVSNSEIIFEYEDGSSADYVFFDEETDTFVFLKKYKMVSIIIKATDGSNVKTEIRIIGI